MELAKSFEPADIEKRWYPRWEAAGHFAAGLDTRKDDNFCILLPPSAAPCRPPCLRKMRRPRRTPAFR